MVAVFRFLSRAGSWAWLYGLIVPALLLLVWAIGAKQGWLSAQVLPAPAQVWDTLRYSAEDGELGDAVSISLRRVFWGFLLGAGLGVGFGAATGLSRTLREYLDPGFRATIYLPLLGWLPLFVMVLGVGEALKVVLIAKAAFVPVALNTYGGIRNVPRQYFELAGVYRFGPLQRLRSVVFPAALPQIWSGLRLGLSVSFMMLVAVEYMTASEGLGYQMASGQQLYQMDLVLAMALVIGVVGLLQDRILAGIEAWLLRWRRPAFEAH